MPVNCEQRSPNAGVLTAIREMLSNFCAAPKLRRSGLARPSLDRPGWLVLWRARLSPVRLHTDPVGDAGGEHRGDAV